jgi:hypothetical protein
MHKATLRLTETNLPGHLTFHLPPEGFSPLRATHAELAEYGLPHRPDPKVFPREARLWRHAMSRIKKFVKPTLTPRPARVHGQRNLPVFAPGVHGNQPSNIWSGLVATAGVGYTQIWGSWLVPTVTSATDGPGFSSSIWIGLNDASSLFQAGTDQDTGFANLFTGNNPNTTYPWYEWFPGPTIVIGLEVLPGHSVGVNLQPANDGTGSGVVSMINYTTGDAITPIVMPPPTTDFNNNTISPPILTVPSLSADWIIERPSNVVNGNPVPSALADFGIAGFLYGGALNITSGTVQKGPVNLVTVGEADQGTLLNMIADDGVTILAESQERPGLTFFFFASGP